MREGSCRKEFSYDSLALVVIKFRSFSNILPKNSVACFESRTARVIEAIIRIIIITHENMQNFLMVKLSLADVTRCVKGRISQIRTDKTPIIKAPIRQITDNNPRKS